jgi:hypothetical protein
MSFLCGPSPTRKDGSTALCVIGSVLFRFYRDDAHVAQLLVGQAPALKARWLPPESEQPARPSGSSEELSERR